MREELDDVLAQTVVELVTELHCESICEADTEVVAVEDLHLVNDPDVD